MLRDLIKIPDQVHSGDFVLTLSKGVEAKDTISEYVVTDQLADCFDTALGLIKSAIETRSSLAAYLDGSFGSGKSHFMAVLHAILRREPEAREKKGLQEVVAKHDRWMQGRRFLLVPFHMIDATSLESAILGGYVSYVRKEHPDKPLPAVYRDEGLLADARDLRRVLGDDRFIEGLPSWEHPEWGATSWDASSLDTALAAPPGDPDRRRLVGDLLATHFTRYASAVSGTTESFIELDKGLSEISRHAKEVLDYDVIVLLLDELVLWLSSYIGNTQMINTEAQKVSKLVESAEHERPAPIASFVPRQRDLRELVSRNSVGAEQASLFDTLKYWDGRFDRIKLEDRNLPVIVEARLLEPRTAEARQELDAAFERTTAARPEVWEALLDAQGGNADRASFRRTYPFSPAFLHAMVDISSALQRQRTALKLMQQLLVDYRDLLPVGQLMPMGAIYDVLASGQDRPFTDKLRTEFDQAKAFYSNRLLPYLLAKHRLTEDQIKGLPSRHAFRADDLVVKTLLLAALVPNVPALRNLTASRLAALNHGSIAVMLAGQERAAVARTLRELAGEFGEIRVSDADDPSVEIALIGVDTKSILNQVMAVDDEAARRRLVKSMLWEEFKATERGHVTIRPFLWKGTDRFIELVFGNVRDKDAMSDDFYHPQLPGAVRVVVDYPFDEGDKGPAEDRNRVWELQTELDRPLTLAWLPSHLSQERLFELGDLVRIEYVLERRDRLDELTPLLSADDRHHARTQLESRRSALRTKLLGALKKAYGLAQPDDADLGRRADEHIMPLDSRLTTLRPPAGLPFGDALERLCSGLLDYAYPKHPDFDIQGKRKAFTKTELNTVLKCVEQAVQNKVSRLEVARPDLAVLKRIANPLEIGMADEVFVLRDEWKQRIDRRAAQSEDDSIEELRVGRIKRWILDEQPGLPDLVVDLLVVCYAIQDDRAWIRGGKPIPMPDLGRLATDMTLRRQELPTEEEFELVNQRAADVFGLPRQLVRSARSVQVLATGVRQQASVHLPAAEALVEKLKRHRQTLGLESSSARFTTARQAADLLNQLSGVSDPTTLIKMFAAIELPDDSVPAYRASITTAQQVTAALNAVKWSILDQLPSLAAAEDDRAGKARTALEKLHEAAQRNEYTVGLGQAIDAAEESTIALLTPIKPPPGPRPQPPKPHLPSQVTREIKASRIAEVTAELQAEAEAHPGATYEITWRIVKP